jgi:hypothetical protein
VNASYENQPERAVAYSIYSRDNSTIKVLLSRDFNAVLGGKLSSETVKNWVSKFKKTGFNINDFITVLRKGSTAIEVSERTTHALERINYQQSIWQLLCFT